MVYQPRLVKWYVSFEIGGICRLLNFCIIASAFASIAYSISSVCFDVAGLAEPAGKSDVKSLSSSTGKWLDFRVLPNVLGRQVCNAANWRYYVICPVPESNPLTYYDFVAGFFRGYRLFGTAPIG